MSLLLSGFKGNPPERASGMLIGEKFFSFATGFP
jgi:hypothetical protein